MTCLFLNATTEPFIEQCQNYFAASIRMAPVRRRRLQIFSMHCAMQIDLAEINGTL